MQANRASMILLLGLLGLSACGSEFDEAEFDQALELAESESESDPSIAPVSAEPTPLDALEPLDPDEPPPDEIEATSNEQTVSCNLGLPDNITANFWTYANTSSGALNGILSGAYTIEIDQVQTSPIIHYWEVFVDGVYLGYDTEDGALGPFFANPGDTLDIPLHAYVGAFPGWTYTFDVEIYSYPNHQLICSDQTTMTIPTGCLGVAWWYQHPFPTPWDDGANCYVATLPPGATGFMYQGAWYVTPTNGNQCSIGGFDGANCYIGAAPLNREGFIWEGKLYYDYGYTL